MIENTTLYLKSDQTGAEESTIEECRTPESVLDLLQRYGLK
jgi:hypothetical protein